MPPPDFGSGPHESMPTKRLTSRPSNPADQRHPRAHVHERSEPTMSWTIACFCGNIYTAPPNRCAVCGSTIEDAVPRPNARATDADSPAPHVTDADRQGLTTQGVRT